MKQARKTKAQLFNELEELRQRVGELEESETELTRAENKHQQSEERFRSLVETTTDWFWEVDENAIYTYSSPKIRDILGYEPEEVLGKTPFALMTPEEADSVAHSFALYAKSRRPFTLLEKTNIHKEGHLVVLETSGIPIFDGNGVFCGYRGIDRDITERKKVEQAIRASEMRLRTAIESLPFDFFIIDKNGRYVMQNSSCRDRWGDVIGKRTEDLEVVEDNLTLWLSNNRRAFEGEVVRDEVELEGREGKGFFYNIIAPVTDGDRIPEILGVNIDITERKRAEEALRESETRFRELADLLPQSVFELDLKGHFTYSNRCGFETFGYTREDLEKGVNALQLYIPEQRERVQQNIMKRLSGEEFDDHEYTGLRKDGSTFPILVYSSPIIRSGKRVGVRGIVLDITDRKQVEEALEKLNLELEERVEQRTAEISKTNVVLKLEIAERERAEQALRESEERYRTVLEANPDPVVVYDMEGRITYLNPAFTNTFGWTLEERLGKKTDVFVPEDSWPETKTLIDRALAGESFSGFETHRLTKQGNIIPVSVSAAIYRDRDGNPVGSVVNLRDISEQKEMEAQLQHVQKMEAVGTLAGGIAHEFNNLLQAVQGYAELLIMRGSKEDTTCRELQEIVSAAKRGGELSQQLLTFSRKIESKLRPVDINLEVNGAVKLLSRTIPRMIEIELHLGEGLKTVDADPAQIEQILVNLAVNAKDAMPEGGKLTIATETSFLDEEYCRRHTGAKPGQYTVLVVSDTGHGMDEETRERIFEPFFTTKGLGEGTGLGLAMIYGIVKNHGGHITCSSEPGAGTTFKFYFPAIEQAVQFEKVTESELLEGGTETILLVDDEDFILDLGKEMLSEFGYTVLTARDGKTALELYRNEQGQIDLVILDMIMPGMSGRQCLKELLRIDSKVKVVISSGYSHIGPRKETIKAGARGFIGKPYEMKKLLQVVREALDQD